MAATQGHGMNGIVALGAGYILSQFFRTFLSVLTPILSTELGMSKGALALASGIWFFAFALMQFPVGIGLDRFGPRRTTVFILAPFATAGGLLFAAAQAPWMVVTAMALIGIGLSPVLMAAMFVFAKRFDAGRFAALSSLFIGTGVGGAVLGASPLAMAAETFGWRGVMAALALVSLAVALWINASLTDPPAEKDASAGGGLRAGLAGYGELLRLRALWLVFPAVFMSYGVMIGTRGLWAGPFLSAMHGADAAVIGRVTLWMSLAMVAATLSIGPLVRLAGSEKRVSLALNCVVAAACAVLAVNPAMALPQAAAVLCAIALFGSAFVAQAAHGRKFYPPHLVGRGVTLLNAISIGGAGILQFVTGGIVSTASNPGAPGLAWTALFGFYAVALAATTALYAFSLAKPAR